MALFKSFAIYVLVGLMALAVDMLVFGLCRWAALPLWGANPLARLAGAITAYTMHRYWTFQVQSPDSSSAGRYMLAWCAATVSGTLGLAILAYSGISEMGGKVLTEGALLVVNYLVARTWVFKRPMKGVQ